MSGHSAVRSVTQNKLTPSKLTQDKCTKIKSQSCVRIAAHIIPMFPPNRPTPKQLFASFFYLWVLEGLERSTRGAQLMLAARTAAPLFQVVWVYHALCQLHKKCSSTGSRGLLWPSSAPGTSSIFSLMACMRRYWSGPLASKVSQPPRKCPSVFLCPIKRSSTFQCSGVMTYPCNQRFGGLG